MSIQISLKKSTTNPTGSSGLTLGEPVFNYGNNTLWMGLGGTTTPVWIGAGVCGASGGIAAGLTYQIPTLGAVKDYFSAVSSAFLGTTASYVISFNGNTGAVQGVSSAAAGTGISVSAATGAVTITNIGVQSFNGLTGAVTGASLGANTFTGLQTMNAGISASSLYVGGGVTFGPYINGSTIVIDSPYVTLGDVNGEGENYRIVIDNSIPAITINGFINHAAGNLTSFGTIQGNIITSDTYVSAVNYVSSPQYLDSYSFVQTFRTTTTAATANQTIAQIDVVYTTDGPTMVYPSFEATISAWDSVLNKTEILKMLIVQNGTDTVNTQYGLIRTGATGPVSSYSTTLQTVATEKNLLIRATPSTSNPTQFTVTVRAHNGT